MQTNGTVPKSDHKLFVVDGHSYAYRAFYAIRQLNSPTGQPTNALYGFIRMFQKMRATLRPSHVMVVWDGGLAPQRTALLPSYKAHRPQTPPALEVQFESIGRFLRASKIASYLKDGVEADDWIATLSKQAVSAGFSVVIASSDKDFMQLVSDSVGLLNPNDKAEKIWTSADVRAKTGVGPEQIVDWLSLIGDTVDNIIGVPGVGPLRATQLLTTFGSVENLYRRLPEVSSDRVRAALQASEADVRRNQSMIRLYDDLTDPIDWHSLIPTDPDRGSLLELYEECGFKTLIKELQDSLSKQGDLL